MAEVKYSEDHVAQLLLGVLADADRPEVALDADPLVLLAVLDAHRVSPIRGSRHA